MDEIILYEFWRSSSSWRVRWALAVKGVVYRSVAVDLRAGAHHTPEHHARNPAGYVPTLYIDGRHLGESVAILEYLEERNPTPPLYPREPWQRARVRQIVELVNSGVQPLQNLTVLHRVSPDADKQKEWAASWNTRGMQLLEALLSQLEGEGVRGPFAFGDALTAADLYLVPQVDSARRFGVELSRYPRVLRAEAAALATPLATKVHAENQPK